MNKSVFKQLGLFAGYLIVPLLIASAISLITYQKFEPIVISFLLALVICIALFAVSNPKVVGQAFTTQGVRNTVTTIVIAVSVIGIVVLVNVLATRLNLRVDTTKNQAFTLNDSSIKIAQQLKAPVKVTVLYSGQNGQQDKNTAVDLLNSYKAYAPDNLNIESYDVTLVDGLTKARELNVTTAPTIVFQQGSKREDATTSDEQSITRALARLGKTVDRRVFFVTGHGERSTTANSDPNQPEGFSSAAKALTDNNYKVDTLNLFTKTGGDGKTVQLNPANDILIFAAPATPYRAEEVQYAASFLKQGGRGMFFFDPVNLVEATAAQGNVNDILKSWEGLKFVEGIVLETDPSAADPRNPLVFLPKTDASSDITKGISSNFPAIFAYSASIDKGTADLPGFTSLLATSAGSYLKTDVNSLNTQAGFDAQKDKRGPLTVAASFETDAKETPPATSTNLVPSPTTTPAPTNSGKTRLVLFASTTWASDNSQAGLSKQTANYNLFVNSVNWLAEEKDAVVINSKTQESTPFTVTKSQDTFIYYSSVFGLPILVFFLGFVIWWRRR